jgi:conjugal transfer pilus assembly protein TraI
VAIEAVKLTSPAILFAGIDTPPTPLTNPVVRAPDSTRMSAGQPLRTDLQPRAPAATSPPGSQQLPLPMETDPDAKAAAIAETRENSVAPACSPNHSAPAVAPTTHFKLEAPLRLNPVVRDALTQIVETLNVDGPQVAACTVSAGVFIPLSEFERRNIDPSLALRALADVSMLVQPAGTAARTVSREFGGEHKVGLVLSPRFVAGLDGDHFKSLDA